IYDPRRAAIYQRLGIATVAPALWTTERVLRRLVPEAAAVEWVDPSAKVSLVERSLARAWAGHKVLEVESAGVRVVAVSRLGSAILPNDQLVAQEGDVLYLAVAHDALSHLDELTAGPSAGHGH
ncbi:MAG: TrkA C-terminal domain-containing protein, partial [Ilumatobacteraceae bacterium]